ncbi:MAG: cell division protein FtsZ [Methanobacterium formicicum]|uniref:Cell division protein FtsZ n=1 Tax=Methanobacterium formicicum TaxID=2162 RepID=A0A089ZVL0_METFO|nr:MULTISPECIES: cell division protein FtsZ [Methanobacterium]AIS32619.1 cell division protein FtsZ [Methanobacterium formicicum]MBF4475385.1 cell division protein FtsZ [Methanobacterium formicicum]MDD4809874.1 cell division protein FtsZ [Methanobacterium formicicum]MDG3546477.1 cell division protein FtsZ [Methanobacterium formicicum]MDH2658393.1 cell division protein FtsZ [Methanobacterium formicicum]
MKSIIDNTIRESEKRRDRKASEERRGYDSSIDQELEDIIQRSRAKICVVGTGGGGNNTVSRLTEIGIEGAETISMNTDAQDLFYSIADKKILIGRNTCGGLGAGGMPEVGEECAEESDEDIKETLEGADMVFVTCGMGGGTGTGSAPVIAKMAKKIGALTIAVATMPFSAEGLRRRENAETGLEKLQSAADTVIVIPNDKLLEVAPNLPINKAFMVADELLGRAVKGITELITKPGLVSLDFADIRSIMMGSGMAMIGMGESDSGDRAIESVHEALNSPLLDLDISNAKGALINISGSSDLTLNEAEKVVQIVADELDPDANIIWGTQIQEELQNTIRTTIVVAGVKSPYIFGVHGEPEYIEERQKEKVPESSLEEFIDGVF